MKYVKKIKATCEHEGVKAHYECITCNKLFKNSTGSTEITDKASVLISTANISVKYNEYSHVYYVSKCDNSSAKIALIAATYKGNIVSEIDTSAFSNYGQLESVVIPATITDLGYQVFEETKLTTVYYIGSKDDFEKIKIGSYNTKFKNATKYYYSETKTTDTNNKYWHLVDGEITVWEI